MAQKEAWEKEYRNPQLVAFGTEAQKDTKNFLRFLRKTEKVELEGLQVLDLGSGTGKNAQYIAALGNTVVGLELSPTAVAVAKERAQEEGVMIDYRVFDIGQTYPFPDESFDLVLDIMTSNSLSEAERGVYLTEVSRVLKQGGHFFVRGLCKDGDDNAKALIKMHPGKEYDTYINPDMNLTERVFTEADFRGLYGQYFSVLSLEKKTNYQRFKGQSYKRNYWLGYLRKEA